MWDFITHLKFQHFPSSVNPNMVCSLPSKNDGNARHKVLTKGSRVGSTPKHKPHQTVGIDSDTTC